MFTNCRNQSMYATASSEIYTSNCLSSLTDSSALCHVVISFQPFVDHALSNHTEKIPFSFFFISELQNGNQMLACPVNKT